MASITATFDIGKPRDAAGREVTPPPDFLSGFTRCVGVLPRILKQSG